MMKRGYDIEAVLIGNPESIFTKKLATYWQSQGIKTAIITRCRMAESSEENVVLTEFDILYSGDFETRYFKYFLFRLEKILIFLEKNILKFSRKKYKKAMGVENNYKPSFVEVIINALSISILVKKINPRFVFGQEVFAYGLATAFCTGLPRFIMPWGGDVYMYAHTTFVSEIIVKYARSHVDLVFPGSVTSVDYIIKNYKVKKEKVIAIPWGVNIKEFFNFTAKYRSGLYTKYKIDQEKIVLMNVRRFSPTWGSNEVLNVFIKLAKKYINLHFIILGGGVRERTLLAIEKIKNNNLNDRFLVFTSEIEYKEFVDLILVSDVFVSLMHEGDMRSSSVMQATYACGVPVVSDLEEYRLIEKNGFKAIFVDPNNTDEVVKAIEKFMVDSNLRSEFSDKNKKYIEKYENYDRQMMKMLKYINKQCENNRSCLLSFK
jgi:glycosyltransferase involved in cell wall biosynthesis